MTNEPKAIEAPPPLVDRGQATELFIDGYQGISITNGVAKLNTFSTRLNPNTGEAERVVVCYLAMPLSTLASIHAAFGALLRDLRQEGIMEQGDRTDEKG